MEGAEDEQRRRKLQAGREKLAHFIQRKAKGESSKTKKKTPKRKKTVHTHDVSKEEDTLAKVECADMDLEAEEVTSESITSLLNVSGEDKMTDMEAKLGLSPDDSGGCAEGFSELQTPLKDNLTDLLHKTKPTTASDWDEYITQLPSNLSWEEGEDEALSLSSRVQAIQSHLQNANKVLEDKSPGKMELHQAEQQLCLLQISLGNQTKRMSQLDQRAQELEMELENSQEKTKQNENQVEKLEHLMEEQQSRLEVLQEKLEKSENSVSLLQQELCSRNQEFMQPKHELSIQAELGTSLGSDIGGGGDSTSKANEMDTVTLAALVVDLKDRLAESETLRESLLTKIKEQMLAFEMERSSWEQKQNETVADLTLKLQEAEEIAAQDKHEKDRLNKELRDLKNSLRLEAESCEAIKLQHEGDVQKYDMKLRSLEEGETKEKRLSTSTWKLQDSEDYSHEIADLKITNQDTRADFRHGLEDLKKNLSRVKARKELENSKAVELDKAEDEVASLALTSLDKYLIPNQLFDLNNSQEDFSEHSKFELDSDFILEQSLNSTMEGNIHLLSSPMPITGVLAGGATLGTLLDPESFAVYLSSNTKPSGYAEISPLVVEDLRQKCSTLMERLQDKEEQLQKSSEALAEALQRWRDVTNELAANKLEMEKVIKKECSEEELRILEEIKSERDDLRQRVMDQEQLLREVQEQNTMNEEYLSHLAEDKTTLENRLSAVEKELESKVELCKNLEISNDNLGQNLQNLEMARECERQEFDNKLNSKGVEQQLLQEAIRAKETEFYQREEDLHEEVSLLRQQKELLENKLREEVNQLNAEFVKRMDVSGDSWREQIVSLNQAHGNEIALLKSSHEQDLQKANSDRTSEEQRAEERMHQLEKAHSLEMEQTQSAHNLEMEAMRLSLNNLHIAHLELSQSNLLKEKEDALMQLRDQLNNKWAQDLAILQSKNQFEVERLRDEHRRALEHLRDELSKETSQRQQEHLKDIELLKENCAIETLELEGRQNSELECMQKMCEEQKLELEKKSDQLRLLEEQSLVTLSNLKELHIQEREEMLNLHQEERNQWEMKADALSSQLKDSLEGSERCRKEMLNMEDQNVKQRTELTETNSKHSEEIEQMQKKILTALQQNEELSRQIESLSEKRAMEESKLGDHKDLEILDHGHDIEKQEYESEGNKPLQELEQLKELSQMSKLHSHPTDQLEQKHTDGVLHLQGGHSQELKELTMEKQEWERQQEEQAKKMLQLQMQCENLENTHLQEKIEWENQTEEKLEILKRLNEEIAQLQEEHSKAIKHLQKKQNREIEEIQQHHILEKEEWEKQRDQHSQELDLLVNQHSQELKRIGEKLLQNSLQKQEEHSKQLEQIQEDCTKQILALQEQHLIEIQKMSELYMQENLEWKKQVNPQTAPKESCTHQELLKDGICMIEEIHAKESIVLEQCKLHSEQLNLAGNLNPQEDLSELTEERNVQELQDQPGKQTEASQEQVKESSPQQQKAFVPDPNNEQAQYNPQQPESEILDDYVQYQINYSEVKIKSSEEIQLLWSQVDSSRASRQELNDLKQQLSARSTQLEQIERMRKNFEQERLLLKAEHEKEMEELRIYFEQKSSSAEETYREELEILHQRLREMNDDEKVEMTPLNCSSLTLEESFESEKLEFLQHLTHQLEEHKEELAYSRLHVEDKHKQELENLHAALSLQYKEDVVNLKMDLSEKYTSEIEALKKKHCLDLEKLRARLSEAHIREIRRMHLQKTQEAVKHGKNIVVAQNLGVFNQTLGEEWCNDDVKNSESPSGDYHSLLKQLEENVEVCQMDDESTSHSGDEKQERDDEVKMSQLEVLQAQHAKELADVREKMANDLEEITKKLKEEKESALKNAEDRIAQVHMENAKLQKDLLRRTLIKPASVEYRGVGNDDPNLHSGENLMSGISEEKHDLETSDKDLALKDSDAVKTTFPSGLCCADDLNAGFPELQRPDKEPYIEVPELLQRHQEELHARSLEHEAHIQSLEASHLGKLDSLESSYLSEIQKIRDEHALAVEELEQCLLSRLQEKEKEAQDHLEKSRVQWLQQQEQELERLRQELATLQLEKFQAMAEELEVAHREDLRQALDQQLFRLEDEKKRALDVLQEEVLRMEAENRLALQELRDLHKVEVEHQTMKLQEELKTTTEELHRQELVIAELSSEQQALSTEIQGKSDQQMRYQEEIELLKCQSEMLLEQQIGLLKDEFNAEKKSALQEVEEQYSRDLEKVRAEHQMEKDDILKQMEDKNTAVIQLQDKVSSLTKEMDASQTQMDVLVQRRERENQEGEHLVAMLQSDVHAAQQERRKLQDTCQRLLKIFADVLKSTLVTEDLISKKIGLCLDNSSSQTDDERTMDNLAKSLDKYRLSPDCDTMTEHSLMSSDEGYDLSEYLCDNVLGSLEFGLENEEKIVRMGHRLRAAVERLLDMVTNSTLQVEQTREMQKCFEDEFKSRNQDMAHVVIQNQDLLKQLAKEAEEKNQLQLELHKSRGLIDGFALEKATLEEALVSKESSEHSLIVELEKSREQVKILTHEPSVFEPSVFGKEKEVLQRLQEVLSGSDIEAELLQETERLLKEELELHCQAKQDRSNLISQMKMLEMELEEQLTRNQELMTKTSVMTDLQQQIQSLEKQLKSQRQFMDEQAIEREHERDEFQQEIQNLEEQLKQAVKSHGDSKAYGLHDWSAQIETLEARVKEKVDDCKLLLQGREDLEQQITERNDEIDKMMLRIQELEQAALSNADAAKKCSQLEVELQKMQKVEKEVLQDKEALQQQQFNNVLQISALQTKLDEARHRIPVEGEPNLFLKQELQAEREALQRKEKENESLVEQLEQFREELMNKTEEVFQLNMQLDVQRKQYEQAVQQAQEEYLRVKDEVATMHSRKSEDALSFTLQLPQALLQEKNQEIDHLNEQILRLQQEATGTQSAEVEEIRSLVELLRSDLERLRKDKEEEIEQLHEVIEKLQKELELLGPNRHEISDSQESLDHLDFGEVENLQQELRKGAKKLQGREENTTQGREDTEHTHRTELEALHQELEEKDALHINELDVLERNLHNVQQSCRQHEQALETLQGEHRNLQEENELLWTRFSEREEQISSLSSQLQELQDRLREKDRFLMDKDLLVQTMQEQSAGDQTEYENQLAHSALSLEAAKMELQKLQEESISLKDVMLKLSNEQKEREEGYRQEIQYLKQRHSDWEQTAQILTEEVQTQTEDEFMDLQIVPQLVSLKKQLQIAENLASLREADLHDAQTRIVNMEQELEELHSECERREAKAQDALQQLQKREICVSELQTHSQKLGTQVKKLQDALVSQEAMIALMSGDLPKKNVENLSHKPDLSRPGKATSFSESLTDLSTWDSPEMVRKQEAVHSLGAYTPFSELSIAPSAEIIRSKSTCIRRPEDCDLLGSSTPSLSESNFSAQRASPLRDAEHTDYGSGDDLRSSRDDQMDSEKSHELDHGPELSTKSEQNYMESLIDIKGKMGTTVLSPQLQRMLNMVHEESCKILELSERPLVKTTDPDSSVLAIKIDTWQKEKQSLQETIQSLSSALAQAADKGEKESTALDWRRDLLQSVQALLESEREYLRLELQSDIRHGSGDKHLLSEKVEHLIKEQEEQKRLVLEHVLAVDRSSLVSEIQDLRSQLRMAHLQNQEKLQKLQDTFTSTEEKGHSREHQLRRQVELLEYKLQQEASIAEDVKGSLSREKERASEQYKLLLQEQAAVSQLRSELEEKDLEMESLRKSQKELQKGLHTETSQLRDELENKDKTMSAYIKKTQSENQAERQRSGEERSRIQKALEINEKCLQEVSLSLEEHKLLNAKMSTTLSQEQTLCSNLKKELEIEQSRCKALLAQEHSKLSETVQELGKEKQHSLSLVNTLTLERGVLEQVRQQHTQELSKKDEERQQEHKLVLASQSELKDERKRARDLAAMIEKTQQQAVHAKRQLEYEIQVCREEIQKEREAGVKLRALLESLQSQKQQLDSVLDQQKERELRLQKERDQSQAQVMSLQEKERTWVKEIDQESRVKKQAKASRARLEEQERQIMDLHLQHEQDRRRIQDLQQMLADLEEQERALASRKSRLRNDSSSPTKKVATLITHMERVWQQLFHIVLQVKKWVQNKSNRTNEGFPSEAEVTALLDSLSELKSEMQKGYVQSSQSPSGVLDVLKRENEELAVSVSQLTKEKLELKSQLSKLAKSHQDSLQKSKDQVHADVVDSVLEAERAVWLREKRLLQIALKHAESERSKATLENRPMHDVPNSKMQRLYRTFLRAESFRKALVYQKKYLLLLLGGFQACEKATLSLIARMGVYPSPADVQRNSKCQTGLGKFRSAVRAVIAISRLKFLVRKWHKVNRKSSGDDSGTRQVPVNRMDVLQQLGGTTLNSPPTRDLPFSLFHSPNTTVGTVSLKPSYWTPKGTGHSPALTHERSRHSSQDPEHSITEYIQHLELVQRRLGGVQNGSSPEQSRCIKYARK
ncbi:pericentrin isoform 2-T2 [Anomaloglossus baeobatrachus]|uniref:pericentrin isoform X2 n=1 Tax=Anomaloglossus baeobatrachus TaxID=238106 RepID=UPI003F4FE71C